MSEVSSFILYPIYLASWIKRFASLQSRVNLFDAGFKWLIFYNSIICLSCEVTYWGVLRTQEENSIEFVKNYLRSG